MKTLFFVASLLLIPFITSVQAHAECRTFTATAQSENLLEARYLAKVRRNLQAIRIYGRRRMCGHARHTEMCNRYLRHNVRCRIGTRNRVEPVHICVASGTVCSIDRRRERFDGPQGFIGPFRPFLRERKQFKRRRFKRRENLK